MRRHLIDRGYQGAGKNSSRIRSKLDVAVLADTFIAATTVTFAPWMGTEIEGSRSPQFFVDV